MSWSVGFVIGPEKSLAHAAADVTIELIDKFGKAPEFDDQIDQFSAAVVAAGVLIESGAFGSPDKTFYVTLSGHANPGHEPRGGWPTTRSPSTSPSAAPIPRTASRTTTARA